MLTRYLLGNQAAAYDAWLAALITRLTKVAKNPKPKASIYLHHYPSEEAWQAAVNVRSSSSSGWRRRIATTPPAGDGRGVGWRSFSS